MSMDFRELEMRVAGELLGKTKLGEITAVDVRVDDYDPQTEEVLTIVAEFTFEGEVVADTGDCEIRGLPKEPEGFEFGDVASFRPDGTVWVSYHSE